MKAGPRELTPWRGEKPYGFGFLREIQPVLDRNCVGCHDGEAEGRPNFQSLEPIPRGREFAGSYHALHPFVNRPGSESDFQLLTPMDYHVSTSELFQLLDKGHYGVELPPEDMKTLITWTDPNVPYHPTWTSLEGNDRVGSISERARELRKKYTGLDDDPNWMPPAPKGRPEFVPPKTNPEPEAPKRFAGLPFNESTAKKMQGSNSSHTLELGDGINLKLRKIPMSGNQSIWMAETELTNEQFRQFKPEHDSRAIDT
ncbi:MAG: hypothetical protein V3V05_05775 [Pontiella sp.]